MSKSHSNTLKDMKSEGPFYSLTRTAVPPIIGDAGILQYHFTDESLAEKFLAWTREQKHVKELEKAYIEKKFNDEKKAVYIIRLTEEQRISLSAIRSDEIKQQESFSEDDYEFMECEKQLFDDKLTREKFIQLINTHSAALISAILPLRNRDNDTVLHIVSVTQPGEPFKQLIQKVSAKAINAALAVANTVNYTVLHLAASEQPGDAFNLLIQTASAEAINTALPLSNNQDGSTALHYIVWFQPDNVVLNLVKKASTEALSKACLRLNNENQSVLEWALSYLSAPTIAALLNKIDDQALEFLVTHKMKSPRLASSVMSNIIFETSWQTEPLLSKLCKMLNPDVTLFCCEAWLNGHDISPAVIKAVQPYLASVIQDLKSKGTANAEKIAELKKMADAWDAQDLKEIKQLDEKALFTTGLGSKISVDTKNENQLRQLYKEGLKSPVDFRLMKKYFPQSIATQIAEDLRRADRLYSGTTANLDLKEYQEYPDHYLKVIQQGNAIFKMVKPQYTDKKGVLHNDWPDFVKQFRDFRFRPELREKTNKSLFRSKFHHRTGKIIDFKEHKPADKKKTYFSTKKQSATLLSKRLNTTVFGEQHADAILVGILADISCYVKLEKELPKKENLKPNEYIYTDGDEKSGGKLFYIDDQKHAHPMQLKTFDEKQQLPNKPLAQLTPQEKEQLKQMIAEHHDRRINKALLARDKGTYKRRWIGDEAKAKQHAYEMKDINYTDLEKFKAMVDEYPNRLNELLTKFTLSSMLGILLVSHNSKSKKIAIERQQDLKNEFNLDLPIIYYNRAQRKMQIYSYREQIDDAKGTNAIRNKEKEQEELENQKKLEQKELIRKQVVAKQLAVNSIGFLKDNLNEVEELQKITPFLEKKLNLLINSIDLIRDSGALNNFNYNFHHLCKLIEESLMVRINYNKMKKSSIKKGSIPLAIDPDLKLAKEDSNLEFIRSIERQVFDCVDDAKSTPAEAYNSLLRTLKNASKQASDTYASRHPT